MAIQKVCDGGCGTIESPKAVFARARDFLPREYCPACLKKAKALLDKLDQAQEKAFTDVSAAHQLAVDEWRVACPDGKYPHEPDA